MTMNWADCVDRLRELRTWSNDWDGLGSPAPRASALDDAERFLGISQGSIAGSPVRIVPTPDGALLFEWQSADKIVEAICAGDKIIKFTASYPGGTMIEWCLSIADDHEDAKRAQ
jgi:hypothetical protein